MKGFQMTFGTISNLLQNQKHSKLDDIFKLNLFPTVNFILRRQTDVI